jgi:hypothetical protein
MSICRALELVLPPTNTGSGADGASYAEPSSAICERRCEKPSSWGWGHTRRAPVLLEGSLGRPLGMTWRTVPKGRRGLQEHRHIGEGGVRWQHG